MNKTGTKAKVKSFDSKPRWLRWKPQPLAEATPEQLHYLTREMLSGDMLSVLGLTHDGSPDRVDENGDSKARRRDIIGDVQAFDDFATLLSSASGFAARFKSTRRPLRKKNGKVRDIDIPTEDKRLDQVAMLALTLIPLAHQKDALDPGVVGHRSIQEYEDFASRDDGVTIQDVYASIMFRLIREHGPFVLAVDLVDAYPNLPHKAIRVALKELLGLNHHEARRVIESARVRTRLKDGRLHKPKGKGIEQGSPIAPFIFNLVQSLIARRLRARGFESACFGDDIGITATTRADAIRAFAVYKEILADLGFEVDVVVRDLDDDTDRKASRIYDARLQPVSFIKIYLVTTREIGLTVDKAWRLHCHLPPNASLAQARRGNRWKAASKSFLRRFLEERRSTASARLEAEGVKVKGEPCNQDLIVPSGELSPYGEGEPEGDSEKGDNRNLFNESRSTAMPMTGSSSGPLEDEGERRLSPYPYPDSPSGESTKGSPLDAGKTTHDQPTGQGAGLPSDGRVSTPRGGPGAGCPTGANEVEADGHPVSTSDNVFAMSISQADVAELALGHRLRVGDHYRPVLKEGEEGTMPHLIDLRGTASSIPAWRQEWAIRQVLRVTSVKGRSGLLVHPIGGWLHILRALDGDGYRVKTGEDPRGIVATVWKLPGMGEAAKPPIELPPEAEVIVEQLRRSALDHRDWSAKVRTTATTDWQRFPVRCSNSMIARVEVLAQLVDQEKPASIAVPDRGGLGRLLRQTRRAKQVDLHRAIEALAGWGVVSSPPGWLLLRRGST